MAVEARNARLVPLLTFWLLVGSLGSSFPAAAQQAIKLRVKETVPVEQRFGMIVVKVPVKCDTQGNVYVRHYEQAAVGAFPIVRVSPDGKTTGTFNLQVAAGFERANAYEFDVGARGEVYVIAVTQPEPQGELVRSIVRFTSEAKYDSAFELEPLLDPQHVAVFSTGEFLLAGEELSQPDRKPTGRPLQAVYDRTGRFVREIALPRDIHVGSGPGGLELDEGQSVNTLTVAAAGDDGNIYLMRRVADPPVYVLSAGGLVLRRFVVPAPEGFEPLTMKVAGGRVVVQFNEKEQSGNFLQGIYVVVDAQTGEKYAEYWDTPETGGIWACYTPEGFTFLSANNRLNQMTLQRATP